MKLRTFFLVNLILCTFGAAFPQNPTKTPEDCGCAGAPPGTLALVNGVEISATEIDDKLKQPIEQIYQYLTDARRQELYLQINSLLLAAAAKQRGKSVHEILRAEVLDKIGAPSEKELQAYYQQGRARFSGEFGAVQNEVLRQWSKQRESELAGAFANRLRASARIKIMEEVLAFSSASGSATQTVATVNDEAISLSSLDEKLNALFYRQQDQLYELRRQELELRTNDLLLEAEAQRRRLTTQKLLETEIALRLKPVTAEQVRQFYENNQQRLTGTFDQLKSRLLAELQKKTAAEAERAFAEDLRKTAKVEFFLTAPRAPATLLTTDDQPTRGSLNATLTIVEFSDFACAGCAALQPVLEKLLAEYDGKLRLVARDFPLAKHPAAFKAAEAARAQGKYWEYVALLFANQTTLDESSLRQYANRLGLDLALFDKALASSQYAVQVERDRREGQWLGLNGTPVLFLNGEKIAEKTYEGLKSTIETALRKVANPTKP